LIKKKGGDLLKKMQFENDRQMQEWVFEHLPLSPKQKTRLIEEMYLNQECKQESNQIRKEIEELSVYSESELEKVIQDAINFVPDSLASCGPMSQNLIALAEQDSLSGEEQKCQ